MVPLRAEGRDSCATYAAWSEVRLREGGVKRAGASLT